MRMHARTETNSELVWAYTAPVRLLRHIFGVYRHDSLSLSVRVLISLSLSVYLSIRIYIFIYIYVYIHIMCKEILTYRHHVHMHIHIYIHIYIHTYIHTHLHTYVHAHLCLHNTNAYVYVHAFPASLSLSTFRMWLLVVTCSFPVNENTQAAWQLL